MIKNKLNMIILASSLALTGACSTIPTIGNPHPNTTIAEDQNKLSVNLERKISDYETKVEEGDHFKVKSEFFYPHHNGSTYHNPREEITIKPFIKDMVLLSALIKEDITTLYSYRIISAEPTEEGRNGNNIQYVVEYSKVDENMKSNRQYLIFFGGKTPFHGKIFDDLKKDKMMAAPNDFISKVDIPINNPKGFFATGFKFLMEHYEENYYDPTSEINKEPK